MAGETFKIDFMGYRKIAAVISTILVVISIGSLALFQVNWGLDFTGGSLVEVEYEDSMTPELVRQQLDAAGYKGHVVQYFGSDQDVLVRVPPQKNLDERENAKLGDRILESLKETAGDVTLRRSEFVGPAVGEELTNQGGLGLLTALAVVMIYVAFRFQLKFAIGAVVAPVPRCDDYPRAFFCRQVEF